MSAVLYVSTSPRSTWVWAPNAVTASAVRGILSEESLVAVSVTSRSELTSWRGPVDVPDEEARNATDIDIGVDAGSALAVLRKAGYELVWHATQDENNRGLSLFGVPVS